MGGFEGSFQLSNRKHHAQGNYSSTFNFLDDVELGQSLQGPNQVLKVLSIVTLHIISSLSFPANWLVVWMTQDNFFLLLKTFLVPVGQTSRLKEKMFWTMEIWFEISPFALGFGLESPLNLSVPTGQP